MTSGWRKSLIQRRAWARIPKLAALALVFSAIAFYGLDTNLSGEERLRFLLALCLASCTLSGLVLATLGILAYRNPENPSRVSGQLRTAGYFNAFFLEAGCISLSLLAAAAWAGGLYLQGAASNTEVQLVSSAVAGLLVLLGLWICKLTNLLRHL